MRENSINCDIKRILHDANAVCFDVDSTICQDEAIDEFAKFLGYSENEIKKLTDMAMNGEMGTFQQSLTSRMYLLRPTKSQFNAFLSNRKILLSPKIEEFVFALQQRQIHVYLVTGSFRSFVLPVASILKIPKENIFANDIKFDCNGDYIGIDTNQLTSDSGSMNVGKAAVCGLLKQKMGYRNLVMIGDGITDLEASPPADVFIGFGGNKVREKVRKNAKWYVYDFNSLLEALLSSNN
ncbi:unnamed protein product [Dracunculus medinensis]|uniref:Phosphoserine phosphatase n=1 Tax=Dracunculus medinensis TaxID=318479 RepID=A0A0N4UD38_DRAME|nr:unnamed protein product [Dracunculus medinensis]